MLCSCECRPWRVSVVKRYWEEGRFLDCLSSGKAPEVKLGSSMFGSDRVSFGLTTSGRTIDTRCVDSDLPLSLSLATVASERVSFPCILAEGTGRN